MRKVGIITMHKVLNYGSYLQTLATYKYIERLGFDPIIIDYHYPTEYHLTNAANFKKSSPAKKNITLTERIVRKLAYWIVRPNIEIKKKSFSSFYSKHIKFTNPYYREEELFDNPPVCDYYIVGSDQVWNPLFIYHDKSFYLSWVKNGGKRISYASSIAIKKIPEEFIGDFKTELKKFSSISVREDTAILTSILGKDVKQVLDPTFLLDKQDWLRYFNLSPITKGKYILCYILGYSYNPYPYIYEVIEKLRKQLGYKVVFIDGEPANIYRGYKVMTNIGPESFLNLFYYSQFIITTSFHGTAFAINFNKNFISIVDGNTTGDNRIVSIARQLDIENECIVRKDTPVDQIQIPELEYKKINDRLDILRGNSMNFLKKALI